MRWDGLFADLESQALALDEAQRSGEVAERARSEVGRLRLVDRLRPAVDQLIRVECAGLTVRGSVRRVGSDWLLLEEEAGGELVLALSAITAVAGLSRVSAVPGSEGVLEARLGLRSVLRTIAADRSAVRVVLRDGTALDGTFDRVGADFVELAVHPGGELRRRRDVRDVVVIALSGVVSVRRRDRSGVD